MLVKWVAVNYDYNFLTYLNIEPEEEGITEIKMSPYLIWVSFGRLYYYLYLPRIATSVLIALLLMRVLRLRS